MAGYADDKKKDGFALLIGKKLDQKDKQDTEVEPSDDSSEPSDDSSEASSMQLSAAQDLISAVHSKDPQMVLSCMKDLVELLDQPASESSESPEDPGTYKMSE